MKKLDDIFNNQFIVFLLLLLIAALCFYPSFSNLNFFWDDERFIFFNPRFMDATSWIDFWNIKSLYYKSWPLGYSFFWLLVKFLNVNNTIVFKSINIIIHSINAFLLFKIFSKLKFHFPFILSLIFLLHPLNVESVSWIFQVLTILSLTFFLLSIVFLVRFLKDQKKINILWSFLFFAASVTTKSIAILAPFLFLIYFIMNKEKWKNYTLLIPFFFLSALLGLINQKGTEDLLRVKNSPISNYIQKMRADDETNNLNMKEKEKSNTIEMQAREDLFNFTFLRKKADPIIFDRATVFAQALPHYVSMLILPLHQQFIYESKNSSLAAAIILALLIVAIFIILYKKYNDITFVHLLIYFIIFIIPFLGITLISFYYWSNVSDRYTYFLIPGIAFFIGLLYTKMPRVWFKKAIFCYALILGILTINYGIKFNSPLALYQEIILYKKHPVIYSSLFEQYLIRGDLKNSSKILHEGIKEFPNDELLKGDVMRLEGLKSIYEK
ncbi:MAG: hypothetical protein H7177_03410 [Rhizobacter sp.]|nr:hypothetical protein [Bacteriovorax sp.]